MENSSLNTHLLNDFKKGSKQAFEKIYTLYYQDLCTFTYSYTKDKAFSEDLVQSAFLKLWENKESLNIKESIKRYLYRLAYNSFIDTIRKKNVFNNKLEDIRYALIIDMIEEDSELKEKRILMLKSTLERLPKKCKEIFILSKFENLKYQQIAEKLNISKNTVEVQICKAYKILRKSLEKGSLSVFFLIVNRLSQLEILVSTRHRKY